MRISVIGGGAIGLLVSYFLKQNGQEPVIYTRSSEQAKELRRSGLTYRDTNGSETTVKVDAKPFAQYFGEESSCIIAVKQTAMNELHGLITYSEVSYLFLQNGISHLSFLKTMPQKQITIGVVEHGAIKKDFTTVHHLGEGRIKVSSYRGDSEQTWGGLLHSSRFPIALEKEWERMVYEKLIMNASINPLTALLRITNGELLTNPHAFSMMKELFDEAVSVLNMTGRREVLWKELLVLCRNTSLNRSSMLKSVESGKQTEIESITGEVIKRGKELKIQTPYSRFAYEAISALDGRG
ncbi:ketopantoate reductase family protein [Fictibacillus sp. 18YEL24]|uniref:ketopantoate reductase family protein n=1 Tax=Fictibacillus sp. 18YEL24 TaxID=2745875 RepID=UPI0018CF7643|nr:2-dehydropantoate 2-reductase [Fictibacillus sp. 18YEL24]MBH0170673.1 2-dehydropantoate 2-reductase [Fictibacillus sp. 18YEL24]